MKRGNRFTVASLKTAIVFGATTLFTHRHAESLKQLTV